MIIYLDLPLPAGSSDPPENTAGNCIVFYSVLLRMGFTCAPVVTNRAVVSYTAFPPLPAKPAVYFCCTGLGVTSTGRYPASCPMKPGLSSSAAFRHRSRDHLSYLLYLTIFIPYTGKQLPPANSLTIELFGKCSLLTPRKYSRNFSRRFASWYSGSSGVMLNKSGSANCLSTANS